MDHQLLECIDITESGWKILASCKKRRRVIIKAWKRQQSGKSNNFCRAIKRIMKYQKAQGNFVHWTPDRMFRHLRRTPIDGYTGYLRGYTKGHQMDY